MVEQQIDELVEIMWLLKEEGRPATERSIMARTEVHHSCVDTFKMPDSIAAVVRDAEQKGYVKAMNGDYILSSEGEELAKGIIRRHRLAEKLFYEVLELPREHGEAASCEFEHILSDVVVDRVCSFLGHPEFCPHGKKIPQGDCCKNRYSVRPDRVLPILSACAGSQLVVSFVSSKKPEVVRRLTTFGIIPGKQIRLVQKGSAIIIAVGESTVAVDKSVAESIYVKESATNGPDPAK